MARQAHLTFLGVDPSTTKVGVAVITPMSKLVYLHRLITLSLEGDELSDKLAQWLCLLGEILVNHKPGVIGVENPLATRNLQIVDKLARVVGVTMAVGRAQKAIVLEYRAKQHRKLSVGWGISSLRELPEQQQMYHLLRKQVPNLPLFGKVDSHQLDALSLALAARVEYEAGQQNHSRKD